jgi:hypothetical protein
MSSGNTMTAPTYEVKPPSTVLAEDVICQSFIQSSSTLAYACLLIRRGRHDLATHVLHSLEKKPASRFKDMVFYLQAQIGIESGDFAAVKKRLVPRAQQHPNDMVSLSLLASAVFLEWEDWQHRNPSATGSALSEARTVAHGPDSSSESGMPAYHTMPVPTVPSAHAEFMDLAPAVPDSLGAYSPDDALVSLEEVPAPAPSAPVSPTVTPVYQPAAAAPVSEQAFIKAGDGEFGIYQALSSDPNTYALSLWNLVTRKLRTSCKKPGLETLVADLPEALPSGLAAAVRSLEGGEIHKACFSFQGLTVTSLHAGPENLGLVTGNMSQSLLTMVRAENLFHKGTHGSANTARAGTAT